MKNLLSFCTIFFICFLLSCQQIITEDQALEIAIENRLQEGIDTTISLINDSVWSIECLLYVNYNSSLKQIYKIDAKTGELLESWELTEDFLVFGPDYPRTNFAYINDAEIPKNDNLPRPLLPENQYKHQANPTISPDGQWVAFSYGFKQISIVSIDGKILKEICDSCLSPEWTEETGWLIYDKNRKFIYKHNIHTDSIIQLYNFRIASRTYCPKGKWIAYTKSVQHYSEDGTPIIYPAGGEYDLFILSLKNLKETT